ncbi:MULTISPECIES: hypothetical protein [unclassified Dyella]|uniref:hypothetical protein n=1 Tax=unclassified Dyella TaxID=2634549 RepID=UPI000C81CC9A|nr:MULTISPECIES: hypothetical protein [unclassified Dyella]MDR3447956.1 hypothetical protein [Dyella sp.]PMQ02559.1 hypothetical protein DyAD56_23640 [Dyella sp. AD56]
MPTFVLALLWIGAIVSLIGSWITCTMLIFRLREGYPDVYAKVGSPSALSRKAEFLWQLKAHESGLNSDTLRLKKVSVRFVLAFAGFVLVFVGSVIASALIGGL